MPATESERRQAARIAVETSWAKTENRSERTANGRAAFDQKFLDEAGGDPQRAEHLRRAYFARLALKSAKARRKIKELAVEAESAEAELDQLAPVAEAG